MAEDKAHRAFVARSDFDQAVVIFVGPGRKARQLAAQALNLDPVDLRSCTRAPQFDQYAEAGFVPPEILLAAGWDLHCAHCELQVRANMSAEDFFDDEAGLADRGQLGPLVEGREVYCCAGCRDAEIAQRQRIEQARAAARRQVAQVFPEAVVDLMGESTDPSVLFHPRPGERLFAWAPSDGAERLHSIRASLPVAC